MLTNMRCFNEGRYRMSREIILGRITSIRQIDSNSKIPKKNPPKNLPLNIKLKFNKPSRKQSFNNRENTRKLPKPSRYQKPLDPRALQRLTNI